MPDFKQEINQYILNRTDKEHLGKSVTADAMRYAINNNGKRVRPQILLRFLYDLTGDYKEGLAAGCALEMVHTYSLVHDDLPAMDNDDYRRNQPTVHKKFREDIAILAGDGLLTEAFTVLSEGHYDPETAMRLVWNLSDFAGVRGMVYGQELDLFAEEKKAELDELPVIHKNKTGKLLAAPLLMACAIAKRPDLYSIMEEIGYTFGLAFQVQDDVLDVTTNLKKTGEVSSDVSNNKTTYATAMSLDEATAFANRLYDEVEKKMESLHLANNTALELLKQLSGRSV